MTPVNPYTWLLGCGDNGQRVLGSSNGLNTTAQKVSARVLSTVAFIVNVAMRRRRGDIVPHLLVSLRHLSFINDADAERILGPGGVEPLPSHPGMIEEEDFFLRGHGVGVAWAEAQASSRSP